MHTTFSGVSILPLTGLAENTFMTTNLVGSIHFISPEQTFSGLHEAAVAFVEWKVPSFAFTDRGIQEVYVSEATAILQKFSGGKLPKEQIWVNITHALDGGWGIAGEAMTNAELGKAILNG